MLPELNVQGWLLIYHNEKADNKVCITVLEYQDSALYCLH